MTVYGSDFAASDELKCKIAGSTVLTAEYVTHQMIRCETPTNLQLGTPYTLQVANYGDDYSSPDTIQGYAPATATSAHCARIPLGSPWLPRLLAIPVEAARSDAMRTSLPAARYVCRRRARACLVPGLAPAPLPPLSDSALLLADITALPIHSSSSLRSPPMFRSLHRLRQRRLSMRRRRHLPAPNPHRRHRRRLLTDALPRCPCTTPRRQAGFPLSC